MRAQVRVSMTAAILVVMNFHILSSTCWAQSPPQLERAHGTVNIFLASGGTLVAVTDSMLTSGANHTPNGRKLYKLDARTICAMAGFYSEPGPHNLNNLALFVPEIARYVSQQMATQGTTHVSVERRAAGTFYSFRFQLTSHLQAMAASNPAMEIDELKPMIELTLAGYDDDGSVKIAELTLRPRRTKSGVSFVSVDRPHSSHIPTCELAVAGHKNLIRPDEDDYFVLFNVGNRFFCDVAGLPDVAEGLLDDPSYAPELKAKEDPSAADLRRVAIDLEKQTVDAEAQNQRFRVGGEVEVTVLSDGKIAEEPPPLTATDFGQSLHGLQATGVHSICGPGDEPIEPGCHGDADASGVDRLHSTHRSNHFPRTLPSPIAR